MELYNRSFNEPSSDTQTEEVPLFVTYINMVTVLTSATIVIIPAIPIISVIWYTRELHTKYYFFIANLLATNITTVIVGGVLVYLTTILYLLDVNSDSAVVVLKWVVITPFMLLYFMGILSPIPVAIERMIVIAFPFCHRSIMTTTTVTSMLAAMWGLSTLLTIITMIAVPVDIFWPLGMLHWHIKINAIVVVPRLTSIICIAAANSFLQYKITISNRKATENQRLGNEELKEFKERLREIRAQAKPTITLFLSGGIDVLADTILIFIYAVIDASVDPNKKLCVLHFLFLLIETSVILSQTLVYGLYMKKIRNRLPYWMTCYQKWIIRSHNRVGILHKKPQRIVNKANE